MKLSFVAALSMSLLAVTPAKAEPKLFGNAVTLGKVAGVNLTAAQRRAFKWYSSNKAYFGAFYIVPGTDDLFWTRNFHSLITAREAGETGCRIAHETNDCTLYAMVYPKGIDPNGPDVSGLGQRTGKDFERLYPKKQRDGKFGAFAINGAYGYGASFGWDTAEEANAAAIAYCKADSSNGMAPLGIKGREWVKTKGIERCRLVHTNKP